MIINVRAANMEEWDRLVHHSAILNWLQTQPQPVKSVSLTEPKTGISIHIEPPLSLANPEGYATFSADWSDPPKPDPPLPVIGAEWPANRKP